MQIEMTVRQRFNAVLSADPMVDRCPVIEWAPWWDKTLDCWEHEGMPKGISGMEIQDFFELDRSIQILFPAYCRGFPRKAYHGAPLIRDADDYRDIKRFLFPKNAIDMVIENIGDAHPWHSDGSTIVWYTIEGFFWLPRELFGIEPHLYSFYDSPGLYHLICEDLLEWQITAVEQFSRIIKADFMTLAEDMSYNHGSMISEETFEEFIAPYYRRLMPHIKKHGTKVLIDSDGDITKSMPWYIRAGADGVMPLERQAGVDVGVLQQQYPEAIFIGGFDKMSLLNDKAAIDAEIERLLPMLRRGRFLPSMDHQTPPGVSMENYRHYIKRLREVSIQACKGIPTKQGDGSSACPMPD